MLGVPELGGTLLSSMRTFSTLFPWRSTFFKNNPKMSKITNISGIFSHIGGNMSRRGTARDKILFFSRPHRSHVLSKKRGTHTTTFQKKVFTLRKKLCEGPDLK